LDIVIFEGKSRLVAKCFVLSLWQAWEGHAYEYKLKNLHWMGYHVHGLSFDNDLVNSHSLINFIELHQMIDSFRLLCK
jgi:hypothetical protein